MIDCAATSFRTKPPRVLALICSRFRRMRSGVWQLASRLCWSNRNDVFKCADVIHWRDATSSNSANHRLLSWRHYISPTNEWIHHKPRRRQVDVSFVIHTLLNWRWLAVTIVVYINTEV